MFVNCFSAILKFNEVSVARTCFNETLNHWSPSIFMNITAPLPSQLSEKQSKTKKYFSQSDAKTKIEEIFIILSTDKTMKIFYNIALR